MQWPASSTLLNSSNECVWKRRRHRTPGSATAFFPWASNEPDLLQRFGASLRRTRLTTIYAKTRERVTGRHPSGFYWFEVPRTITWQHHVSTDWLLKLAYSQNCIGWTWVTDSQCTFHIFTYLFVGINLLVIICHTVLPRDHSSFIWSNQRSSHCCRDIVSTAHTVSQPSTHRKTLNKDGRWPQIDVFQLSLLLPPTGRMQPDILRQLAQKIFTQMCVNWFVVN